jgi:predicted HTH transcriptional regulator
MTFDYRESGDGYLARLEYKEQRTETAPRITGETGTLNVPLNVPLNEKILGMIREVPGIQRKDLAVKLNLAEKTIGRALSILTAEDRIEHRGSKKTGGYWPI